MRLVLSALASLGFASAGFAQGNVIQINWSDPATEAMRLIVVVRDDQGAVLMTARGPVEASATDASVALPAALPRRSANVQAALISVDGVQAQSDKTATTGRDALPDLTLSAALSLSFQTQWGCETGENLTISSARPPVVTTSSGAKVVFAEAEAGFTDPAGEIHLAFGEDHILWGTAEDMTPCLPLPSDPILPVSIRAKGDSWSAELGLGRAMLFLPGVEADEVAAQGLAASMDALGAAVFRSDGVSLRMTDSPCRLTPDGLLFPFSASATRRDGSALPAACAGDPLRAISGGEWRVTSLLGLPNSQTLSLQVNASALSGRTPCNRYVAQLEVMSDAIAITEIGTTRLACPDMALFNMQQRFLEALESTTHFELGANGMLTLKSGAIPLMTARRDVP